MTLLVKIYHHSLKLLLALIILTFILLIGGATILIFNQEKIIKALTDEINKYPDLSIKYNRVSVNTLKSFPRFSYNFKNLTLAITLNTHTDTILKTDEFQATISPFKLLTGRVSITNFYLSNARIAWKTSYSKELWDGSPSDSSDGINILISGFTLKDFDILVQDSTNRNVLNLTGNNIRFKFSTHNNNISLSVKSDVDRMVVGEKLNISNPVKLGFDLEQSNNKILIYNIETSSKTLILKGSGIYDQKSESLALRLGSNHFEIHDLKQFPNLNLTEEFFGNVGCEAYFKSTSGFKSIDTLLIKCISPKIKWVSKNDETVFTNLEGYILLTNNLLNHFSYINKVTIEKNSTKLNLSAKIKGYENFVILVKGDIISSLNIENPSVGIDVNGPFKILLSYIPKTNRINPLLIGSDLIFANSQKAFTSNISTKGYITINKNLDIEGYIKIDSSDINFKVDQANIIDAFMKNSYYPTVDLSGEYVNYNDIAKILSNSAVNGTPKNLNISKTLYNLNFNRAKYNRLRLSKLKGNGTMKGDTIDVSYFTADCFDGNISGKFKSFNNFFQSSLWINSISIEKILKVYDNWGQKIITSENLSGKFKGVVDIEFLKNAKGDVNLNSLKLNSNIQIVNGKLKGMDKIKGLSRWLNLDQVKVIDFDTLRNEISISNGKISIPNMDVKSNVILMNITGEHTFENRYEYLIRINISNWVKKKFIGSNKIDIQPSTDGSLNLYLKLYGNKDNYKVDLINKTRFNSKMFNTTVADTFSIETPTHKQADEKLKSETSGSYRIEWDEQIDSIKDEEQ